MPPKASLNVSLTPELMTFVSGLVAAGQYRTASEVVRAGLRLLQREGNIVKAASVQNAFDGESLELHPACVEAPDHD
jgi:antitoxin ParD1/3/4